MTETTTKLAGIPIDAPIETVNDAIAQDAALAAVETVAKARRGDLKAYVLRELARPGAKVELDGYGSALITDPQARASIVDDEAFRAWALTSHPDRTETVERIEPGPIAAALTGEDYGPEIAERLREVLESIPGALVLDVVIDAKLADDLAKPSASRELEDGRLVEKASGEIIPGLELRMASEPSPRITPDKALVARLAEEITERLAPLPTLEEHTE